MPTDIFGEADSPAPADEDPALGFADSFQFRTVGRGHPRGEIYELTKTRRRMSAAGRVHHEEVNGGAARVEHA